MQRTDINILLISDVEREHNILKEKGYQNIDVFSSPVVAINFFEEHKELLAQYNYIFVNKTDIDRINFSVRDVYKDKFLDLLEGLDCLVIDYLSFSNSKAVCGHVMTTDLKDVIKYNEYTSFKLIVNLLSKCKIKQTKKKYHPAVAVNDLKPLPEKLKHIKVLCFVPFSEEGYNCEKKLKNFAQKKGIKKLTCVSDNDLAIDKIADHLSDYDIIIASSQYSEKLICLENEAKEQCKYVGKQLLMLETYKTKYGHLNSTNNIIFVGANLEEEIKQSHTHFGYALEDIDYLEWLLETSICKYISKRNSLCNKGNVLETDLLSNQRYEKKFNKGCSENINNEKLYKEICNLVFRYFTDANVSKNFNFKHLKLEERENKDQVLGDKIFCVDFTPNNSDKSYQIIINYPTDDPSVNQKTPDLTLITKTNEINIIKRKHINFTKYRYPKNGGFSKASAYDLKVLIELLQELKQELKPIYNKIDTETTQQLTRKQTFLNIVELIQEISSHTKNQQIFVPGQISIVDDGTSYKITCYVEQTIVSTLTISKMNLSESFKIATQSKKGTLNSERNASIFELPPYNEKELSALIAIQKKLTILLENQQKLQSSDQIRSRKPKKDE